MSNRLTRFMAVMATAAGLVLAQGPPSPGAGPRPGGPRGRGLEGTGPQEFQQRRLDFLATYLGLTDSQKDQAKSLFDAADQASRALRDPVRQAHQALDAAAKASKTDAEIDQLAAALGTLEGQLVAIRTKSSAKFYALLTPDQKEKFDKIPGAGGFGGPPMMLRQR